MLPGVFSHPTTWPRESERPFSERATAKQVELTVELMRRERTEAQATDRRNREAAPVGAVAKDSQDEGAVDVRTWEARAEQDIGIVIRRYLSEQPCPGPSGVADAFSTWSDGLVCDGQARLEELGIRRLRSAQ